MADDEPRAKDLVRDRLVPERRSPGQTLSERIGARRKTGPGSARRAKLFARLGLADPYDADATERSLSSGSVALKLANKRQPARHAKVKQPKSASTARPKWNPQGVPKKRAAPARPKAPPKPPPRPAAKPEPVQAEPEAQPPRPPLPKSTKPARGGRFRMRRQQSSGGPVVREIPPPKPVEVEAPEAPAPPPPPRTPPPGADKGLDDLFGFAQEGRMRMRPRKKTDES